MGVNGRLHSLIFLCTLFWVTSSWSGQNYGPFSNSKLASNAAHPKNIAQIFKPYVSISRLDLVLQINQYDFIVQALQYVHIQIFSDPKSNLSKSTGTRSKLGSTSRWSHPPRIQNKMSLQTVGLLYISPRKVLCIRPLPLSVKHTPPHHHHFVSTLSPCSNKRRKSFPMRLAPRSPLTHSYPRHQVAHAKKCVIPIMKYKHQACSVPQNDSQMAMTKRTNFKVVDFDSL